MNYWMADVANLGECFQPYAAWIQSIRAVRTEATKKAFDGARGWTIRGESGLFGGSTWDWVPGCSAWLLQNSYDHYRFTMDKTYLRDFAYPAMKEVSEFWLDRLKPLPDGTLVTPTGLSPEHGPKEDGISFDMQLAWDVFNSTIEAADILGVDKEFRDLLVTTRDKMAKPKIGKWGQLQEWLVDRDDPKDDHRHTSHLIAVFPGRQISINQTPDLARAAAVSLEARGVTGDSRREWAFAWRRATRRISWPGTSSNTACFRICFARIRRSRWTVTSVMSPASVKCYCKATPEKSSCCPRCQRRGLTERSPACAPAAASKWI